MQVDFTPSSEDMPTVDPVTVTLPVGPAGEPGDDGLTPYIGENGNWWIGDTDTGVSASASGGVVVQAEEPANTDVLWIDTDDDDEPEETDTGTDKSLGITGAEVGQTVRITEVDENGVPTAWEAVEIADGEVWEKLNEFTLEENALSVLMDEDAEGNPFELKKMRVYMYLPKCKNTSGEDTSTGYAHFLVNGAGAAYQNPSSGWDNSNFVWTLEAVGNYITVRCLGGVYGTSGVGNNLRIWHTYKSSAFTGVITSFLWRIFSPTDDKPSAMAGATFEIWGIRA